MKGTTVLSSFEGEVVKCETLTKSYGKHVVIKSNVAGDTIYIWYCHLSSYNVKKGDKVKAGQKIGKVGSTGNSTGNHLHYEIRDENNKHTKTLDPNDFIKQKK